MRPARGRVEAADARVQLKASLRSVARQLVAQLRSGRVLRDASRERERERNNEHDKNETPIESSTNKNSIQSGDIGMGTTISEPLQAILTDVIALEVTCAILGLSLPVAWTPHTDFNCGPTVPHPALSQVG